MKYLTHDERKRLRADIAAAHLIVQRVRRETLSILCEREMAIATRYLENALEQMRALECRKEPKSRAQDQVNG